PGEEVPALAVHPRGTLLELLEQTMHARGDDTRVRMPVAAGLAALPCEREEVLRLAGLQPERRGDPPQRICGRLDVSRLLEPRVPLGADARQCSHFLASQPSCAAAVSARQIHLLWLKPFAAQPQKRRNLP